MSNMSDPRSQGYRNLGGHLEREGYSFSHRIPDDSRPAGIDAWRDLYVHPDGREASVFQCDDGTYCIVSADEDTRH